MTDAMQSPVTTTTADDDDLLPATGPRLQALRWLTHPRVLLLVPLLVSLGLSVSANEMIMKKTKRQALSDVKILI